MCALHAQKCYTNAWGGDGISAVISIRGPLQRKKSRLCPKELTIRMKTRGGDATKGTKRSLQGKTATCRVGSSTPGRGVGACMM